MKALAWAADFGALLGRIRRCRRLGRRNNSLLRLDVHARRQHTDTKRIRGSVIFDFDLRIAESAEKGLVYVQEGCAAYTPAALCDSSNAIITEAISEIGGENNFGASSSSACDLDHGVVPSLFDLLLLS